MKWSLKGKYFDPFTNSFQLFLRKCVEISVENLCILGLKGLSFKVSWCKSNSFQYIWMGAHIQGRGLSATCLKSWRSPFQNRQKWEQLQQVGKV